MKQTGRLAKAYKMKTRMYTVVEYVDRETGEMLLAEELTNYTKLNHETTYKHTKTGITRKLIRWTCTEHGKQLSIFSQGTD